MLTSNNDVQNYWHGDEIEMVRAVLARSWSVTINHIPRERNIVADALAKLALQEGWDWRVWNLPPSMVVPLLCSDLIS